jgi:hypothetical protein
MLVSILVQDSIRAMDGVNGAGGGEPGNQPPPIRRRPRTPQGNRGAPTRAIGQASPDPPSTRPRNPALPRQPTPMNATEVHAHQDSGYGYGHESGYGNTYNNNHVGDVQPGQNEQHGYAEEGHYVYGNAGAYGQGYGGPGHRGEAQDGSAYDGAHGGGGSYGEHGYAEEGHYVYGNAGAYGQGYGGPSHRGEAQDGSAYDGAHGGVGSYGEADGTEDGYGVEGVEGRSGSGGGQGEPSEKCMQCVHGIGVPMARFTTRAAFKGARCVACLCTIL